MSFKTIRSEHLNERSSEVLLRGTVCISILKKEEKEFVIFLGGSVVECLGRRRSRVQVPF